MFLLVKWKGYPEKFNSWVNEKDVKNPYKEYQSSHWSFFSNRNGPYTGVSFDIIK